MLLQVALHDVAGRRDPGLRGSRLADRRVGHEWTNILEYGVKRVP